MYFLITTDVKVFDFNCEMKLIYFIAGLTNSKGESSLDIIFNF